MQYDVVVVGSGHGGAHAAIALRQNKFEGTIALIGEELDLPYERPPLSKEYLSGAKAFERLLIRPAVFWQERDIDLRLGQRVVSVDPGMGRIRTADGTSIAFGQLIWAAGGEPRKLDCPGSHLAGVHTIRNRADVDGIQAELGAVSQVAVIGGGYIGLEAAAVLTTLGKKVVVLEAQDRVLARVAGNELSRFYETEHRARGVDIRLRTTVAGMDGDDRVAQVRLSDGEVIAAQLVVVGIGIAPSAEPLIAAGAEAGNGNGVMVDRQCRTSLSNIFAIGDCASHRNPFAGDAPVRVESVQNAHDQAASVAKAIMGHEQAFSAVPWFWSNQYDLRLQTVGLSQGHDEAVLRGDPANRSFSVIYLKDGRVLALDCVNATKDYVQGRSMVVERLAVDPLQIADTRIPLKNLR